MEVPKVVSWLGDTDFSKSNPIVAKVEGITTGKNKWGKDEIVIQLEIEGAKRQLSLFGDNRNAVIDKFGTDSDTWISKSLQISLLTDAVTGKKIKQIRPL